MSKKNLEPSPATPEDSAPMDPPCFFTILYATSIKLH
jgi:hypothetical protein